MTAAIIGAVALIVAAVFTGVASSIVERRKRQAAARAAALAVASELRLLANKLASAAAPGDREAKADEHEPGWWVGDPPSRAWRDSFTALAALAPDKLVERVATAYGQAEIWQREREAAGEAAPSVAVVKEIGEDVALARGAADKLKLFATWPAWRRALQWGPLEPFPRKLLRWAPALLALLAFGIFVLVPRDNVNSQTVAAAVERAYGPYSLAECDHAADHWACSVFSLSMPRGACLVQSATAYASTVTAARLLQGCTFSTPEQVVVADLGDSLLITPGSRERGLNRRGVTEPTDVRSLFVKALLVLIGRSPNS